MTPSSTKFKVAAAHAAPVFMDKAATISKVVRLVEQAAAEGVKLLVFPETFVPAYPYFIECYPPLSQPPILAHYAAQSVVVEHGNADMASVQEVCRRTGVAISLGVSERMRGGGHTLFNSQVMVGADGVIMGVHRKLQPTYVERMVWGQGDGGSLRVWPVKGLGAGFGGGGGGGVEEEGVVNVGGLACWEHTMNGARQALIVQGEHVHAGAWPALSTMRGFEQVADAQIEALMKAHALTAQVWVVTASNYVDEGCLEWMRANLGEQDFVKRGGGWSAVIHPFCGFIAGPHTGEEEKLVVGEVDLADLAAVKVWIDAKGHYQRPEILEFDFDQRSYWADEKEDQFNVKEQVKAKGRDKRDTDEGEDSEWPTSPIC